MQRALRISANLIVIACKLPLEFPTQEIADCAIDCVPLMIECLQIWAKWLPPMREMWI